MKYWGFCFSINKVRVRHFVRESINKPDWQSEVIKELLTVSEGHWMINLTAAELVCIIDVVCTD